MSVKKTELRYSGPASEKFWARINALPEPHCEYLYAMGCLLQNMEHMVVDMLDEAERVVKRNKAQKSRKK